MAERFVEIAQGADPASQRNSGVQRANSQPLDFVLCIGDDSSDEQATRRMITG